MTERTVTPGDPEGLVAHLMVEVMAEARVTEWRTWAQA